MKEKTFVEKDFIKIGVEYFEIDKFWKEKLGCKIFLQAKI